MRLKLIIGLWISLVILASCEERADYLNWSRKVANYCKYVKFSEESKRYECGPKLGEFYTYIIVHPDYDLPKNPIYPLVAYDKQDNVVMVGGNGKGQIWRMIKFEIWAFVRETKTGMKEVYYDKDEKAFIGLEIGDNKEDIKSKAWWSRDGGKSWVRARVPLFKKKKSNSVVPVSPLVGGPVAPKTPPVLKPLAKAPAGPKLPVGGIAEAVGGGYAVAIGEVGGKPAVWSSKATVPRNWEATLEKNIKNPHTGSLPISLQKFSKSSLGDLKRIWYEGTDFRIEDKDGDVWISKNNGQSWDMEKFGGGSGTVGDPYKIASAIHLWLVREELNKHFKLTNDLDLSVITEEEGFEPIGAENRRPILDISDGKDWDYYKNAFQGTFDGNGKVIKNLKINRPAGDNIGLFGVIKDGAVLKNIGLEGVDVKGENFVGGLIGDNFGTIENSYVMGNVKGGFKVGGLVGENYGMITNSYAMGNVTGETKFTGGLAGTNSKTIKKSYSTGRVTGEHAVGGFVGYNWKWIGNSYATGDVTGSDQVGGFVGSMHGTIKNSYATGDVTGTSDVGELVGYIYAGYGKIIGKNYWKAGSGNRGIGYGVGNVEEKTDAELKALDAGETGWNEDEEIWNFQAGKYPTLK